MVVLSCWLFLVFSFVYWLFLTFSCPILLGIFKEGVCIVLVVEFNRNFYFFCLFPVVVFAGCFQEVISLLVVLNKVVVLFLRVVLKCSVFSGHFWRLCVMFVFGLFLDSMWTKSFKCFCFNPV